ncbi:MAG TPA: SUMF1/EgtB/PvdO family nonheme iron enzyme [Polyangiaceae bacterium]|nr:SUMF1/EgtB/PvdO family nonheme iron enzyme [Polyangiaceae bacterium]
MRPLFARWPLGALLSVGVCLANAVACGNGAQSSANADGGKAPSAMAGSAPASAGSNAAGGSAPVSAGGTSTASGGSNVSAEGGKSSGNAGEGTNPSGGTGAGTAGAINAVGGSAGNAAAGTGSVTPPSCAMSGPGRTTCGANKDESCCTSLPVSGGMYSRTYTNSGSGAMGKADPATLSTFRLDKYETTVARFREYVKYLENGGSPPAAGSGKHTHLNEGKGLADSGKSGSFESGWDASWSGKIPSGAGATAKWKTNIATGGCKNYGTWTDQPGNNDLLPITCTSWYESYAFCIWDGGFLPSEAEWKYAAAGGDEQREYPWGTTAPGSNNEYAIYDCCYPNGKCSATSGSDTCTGLVNVAPVGFASKGVGKFGQLDLIGSVWEWNLDKFANYVSPCTDCAYLTGSTTNRVLPGAGFHSGTSLGNTILYSYNRTSVSYDAETYRGDYAVGLRCARSP